MSTTLLPVSERVNADAHGLIESRLCKSDKTPQDGNVLARFELYKHEASSNACGDCPRHLFCGQLRNVSHIFSDGRASRRIRAYDEIRRKPGGAPGRCKRLLGGPTSATLYCMTIKARVRDGRLVVDEPTDLPDGTEIELLPLDPGDWLDEAERAALHKALRRSDADVAAGRLVDAGEILKDLRSR